MHSTARDTDGSIVEIHEIDTVEIHAKDSGDDCDSGYGGGTLLFVGLLSLLGGAFAGASWMHQKMARGAMPSDVLGRRGENLKTPHPKFFKVIRDPEFGRLLRVNDHDVVHQSGPVFAWIDEDQDPPVIRVANLYTGQEYSKTYPNTNALEEDFDYNIVPALDR